jgi:hypothetical protein
MTSARPSAKATELVLLREGDITVQVHRPYVPGVPQSCYVSRQDRQRWVAERAPTESIRVSYRAWSDPVMCDDLVRRAAANKSGEAVRGWAEARNGHVELGMTDRRYAVLAQSAANAKTRRAVEGPVSCRVTLHSKPEPFLPGCVCCKQPLAAHIIEVETLQGATSPTPDARGFRLWDNTLTRQETRCYCPEVKCVR